MRQYLVNHKMNKDEAFQNLIGQIKCGYIDVSEHSYDEIVFNVAKECVEKQVAKKPIKRPCNVTGVIGWYCGSCDIMNVSEKPSYCRRCGTKIDWSDE